MLLLRDGSGTLRYVCQAAQTKSMKASGRQQTNVVLAQCCQIFACYFRMQLKLNFKSNLQTLCDPRFLAELSGTPVQSAAWTAVKHRLRVSQWNLTGSFSSSTQRWYGKLHS